ncbi:phosphate regulon sensor histidine kinase PhoR [Comamonas sp. NLF-1-9]|uniref:phosphate regulon sensor histidine kinase PhoR n=1 Tax=Comamonas sp. NLF-1-9 TaxID=2853163 RepID=UPI001C4426B3|nr:phosphate regulon sensor histidine kinase PhoR [Comamonas sp. NLF-1-9]QXL83327.1 phosphate regulon sensor histidine kinase PhoR [Comamonas sp. NLF-1-9]
MTGRFLPFPALLALGALLGAWLGGPWAALIAVMALACAWFARDAWRAARALAWLRRGEGAPGMQPGGAWGEALDRVRRLLREKAREHAASEQRLQTFLAALQASPNGVLLLDAGGHIEWCNQMAAQHFGLDAQRDRMQSIANLLREPAFGAYLAAGDFTHDVLLDGRQSTPAHPVRLSVRLHPYGDGQRLMLSRDITALEQAEAMRRDFVANVSHEIRTPLTVLAGFVETLQTLPLQAAERDRYLTLMGQQASRMRDLVQDLLTLSRLEADTPPPPDHWTPVGELLARCEQEARALSRQLLPADQAPHRWRFPAPEQLAGAGAIAGAPSELHSALSNLLANAVRHTPAGGCIAMRWERQDDGSARLTVSDDGPGIAPEHLQRLTERFYRVDRERSRSQGGTGLGLAIVKHVAQRHGARLEISSVPGRGSEFALVFPSVRLSPGAGAGS